MFNKITLSCLLAATLSAATITSGTTSAPDTTTYEVEIANDGSGIVVVSSANNRFILSGPDGAEEDDSYGDAEHSDADAGTHSLLVNDKSDFALFAPGESGFDFDNLQETDMLKVITESGRYTINKSALFVFKLEEAGTGVISVNSSGTSSEFFGPDGVKIQSNIILNGEKRSAGVYAIRLRNFDGEEITMDLSSDSFAKQNGTGTSTAKDAIETAITSHTTSEVPSIMTYQIDTTDEGSGIIALNSTHKRMRLYQPDGSEVDDHYGKNVGEDLPAGTHTLVVEEKTDLTVFAPGIEGYDFDNIEDTSMMEVVTEDGEMDISQSMMFVFRLASQSGVTFTNNANHSMYLYNQAGTLIESHNNNLNVDSLPAGDYAVVLEEVDSLVTVSYTSDGFCQQNGECTGNPDPYALPLQEGKWLLGGARQTLDDMNVFTPECVQKVWRYTDSGEWLSYVPETGGDLSQIEINRGFWIKGADNCSLTIYK